MSAHTTAASHRATVEFSIVDGRLTGTVAIEGGRPVPFDGSGELASRVAAACAPRPALVLVSESESQGDQRGLASLTAREHEIVEAAVRGATNREIAESLFYSVKSIEAYLTRTYRKLEIAGRDELRALWTREAPDYGGPIEDLEPPDELAGRLYGGRAGPPAGRPLARVELLLVPDAG